jgi:putative membrane protein
MRFLFRITVKAVLYFAVLLVLMEIGLLPFSGIVPILVVALILAAVNTVIRPVLVVAALPFNILTFGLASVFANLLTLVIASAIAGGTVTTGFWAMLLTAFVIMMADDLVRYIRHSLKLRRADQV